jgi:hypothetical protein
VLDFFLFSLFWVAVLVRGAGPHAEEITIFFIFNLSRFCKKKYNPFGLVNEVTATWSRLLIFIKIFVKN